MTDFSADIGPNVQAFAELIAGAAFAGVTDPLRGELLELAPNVSGFSVTFSRLAETIYAAKATLPADVLRFGAQAAFICRTHRWNGLGDGRGWALQQALQRDAGDAAPEGSSWPDPSADPTPVVA